MDLVEFHLHLVDLLLQLVEGVLDDAVGVLVSGLHLHLDAVLQGMGLPVACELDLLVFEEVDAEEVANGVVLEGDAVGDRVDHLLALDHLYVLLRQLLLVVSTDFEAVILVHYLYYQLTGWRQSHPTPIKVEEVHIYRPSAGAHSEFLQFLPLLLLHSLK